MIEKTNQKDCLPKNELSLKLSGFDANKIVRLIPTKIKTGIIIANLI